MCSYIYIFIYKYVYKYICIYIYIYISIHTSIFLCAFAWICSGVSCDCVCVELYARLFIWSLFSRFRVNNWAELNCVYVGNYVMSVFATCPEQCIHTNIHEYTQHQSCLESALPYPKPESRIRREQVYITSRCSGCRYSFVLSFVRKPKTLEPWKIVLIIIS